VNSATTTKMLSPPWVLGSQGGESILVVVAEFT